MNVKDFLTKQIDSIEIVIYQIPIKEIDTCKNLVRRYQGNIRTSLESNQNYLDFEVKQFYHNNGFLIIVCEANEMQRQITIERHRANI